MEERLKRTCRLIGEMGMERLKKSRVLLFGIGGVGGHCAEALARSGIGHLTLVDNDTVAESNLNRQLFATAETVGLPKLEAARARLLAVAPGLSLTLLPLFFLPKNADSVDFKEYDYVIDAVDTVAAKLEIVVRATAAGVPVISCMATGNKLHPEMLELADLASTSVCPLAKVMRHELKKRGVLHVPVVYSREFPYAPIEDEEETPSGSSRRQIPGSTAFVPATAGLILAGAVVRELSAYR
ncbi:MAG: tRNA threonylcarbamoyladenosine dehydratase [bacterium]